MVYTVIYGMMSNDLLSKAVDLAAKANQLKEVCEQNFSDIKFDLDDEEQIELSALVSSVDDALTACRAAKAVLAKYGFMGTPKDDKLVPVSDGSVQYNSSGATRRGWKHDQLRAIVAEKLIQSSVDDLGVPAPPQVLIDKALQCVSISSWKVGELKKLGVSPDKYCENGTPTFSATVHRIEKRVYDEQN